MIDDGTIIAETIQLIADIAEKLQEKKEKDNLGSVLMHPDTDIISVEINTHTRIAEDQTISRIKKS